MLACVVVAGTVTGTCVAALVAALVAARAAGIPPSAPSAPAPSVSTPPKREFRAAWVATVYGINWPARAGADASTAAAQRQSFIELLDACRDARLNAVIVQVRPSADALYAAQREPWSQWLTGTQGKPPSAGWDPLAFMVDETHKRGMEFHAWFNPYRSVTSDKTPLAPTHVAKQHPDWHLSFSNPAKLLNPGLPQVRDHVTNVVMDVVRNYDIDGVHFDDYFYPYGGISGQDAITFSRYPRGFTNIADWRRDNINQLVKQVADSIEAIKPYVKFGVSPFGVWKTGVPAGIVAADTVPLDLYGAYSVIYCDAMAWLQAQTVDYVMPQLYWAFGSKKDYAKLMPWWLEQAQTRGRHLYTGNAAYKMTEQGWSASEILRQLRANRNEGAQGCAIYNVAHVVQNTKGLRDSLRRDVFRTLALPPTMPWKPWKQAAVPPQAPADVVLRLVRGGGNSRGNAGANTNQNASSNARATPSAALTTTFTTPMLRWLKSPDARFYAVYRFGENERVNIGDARTLLAITPATEFTDLTSRSDQRYTYVVTALDRLWNESDATARVGKLPER
jgi:uncharacterized lipoprotein YddW (UPF0748 family)